MPDKPPSTSIPAPSITLGLIASLLLLSACTTAVLNEGATRVMRVPESGSDATPVLFDQEVPITAGEHFSVSLLSAHICGFSEKVFTFTKSNPTKSDRVGCSEDGLTKVRKADRRTPGEIAIVANVGESSSSRGLTINPADAGTKGRVIYYNEDVRESGQLINAINVPVYGPKKYGGKNVILELSIVELDNTENSQVSAMLQSLAGVGAKAYPPSAPVLGVLNTLGGALLSGNKDDVEMRFQMRFDVASPEPNESSVPRLGLREGYYAFVREENRDLSPKWNVIRVDSARGELCALGGGECTTYRERTWLLVRVARETADAALDLEYGEQLNSFVSRLDTFETTNFTKTQTALTSLGENLKTLLCTSAGTKEKKRLECPAEPTDEEPEPEEPETEDPTPEEPEA